MVKAVTRLECPFDPGFFRVKHVAQRFEGDVIGALQLPGAFPDLIF